MSALRNGIPAGKTRVIYVDLFDHDEGVVKDCETKEKAFEIADAHNRTRKGSMDTVYYVYDDQGQYLRGNEAIKNDAGQTAVGVSP
jgi:hypothetical protein